MEYNPYFIDNGPKTAWWPKDKVHIPCCREIENLGGGLAAKLAWNLFSVYSIQNYVPRTSNYPQLLY